MQMVRRGVLLLSSENTKVLGGGLPKKPPELNEVYFTMFCNYALMQDTVQHS
jgi:prenyltransferase beta subunit